MITEMRKVFALAALIVAAGVVGGAEAATVFPSDAASYARWRIDTAFDVAARMPSIAPVSVPMAAKGDLLVPPGCASLSGDEQAECMDVAYEPTTTLPSVVIETRVATTSTLSRMDAMTVAGVAAHPQRRSE